MEAAQAKLLWILAFLVNDARAWLRLLDMLDGQVARRQNRVTAFGAFYDSTLDRYADMALYMGLLVYYSVSGRTPYVVLAAVATAGSVMVSYARARAESLIPLCKVGF